MLRRLPQAFFPLVLACTFGSTFAHAAIYTWVDTSGTVNVSNLDPPEGVRVTRVIPDSPSKPVSRTDAAGDAARQVEVQALTDRVRQLEYEAEFARRQAPLEPVYQAAPAPQYIPPQYVPPQYMQYPADYAPAATSGCDAAWMDCGSWWGPYGYGYPATVIVLRAPNFRRPHPIHGGHNLPVQRPPMRPPGAMVRR
jgi:hypothetical protein